MTAPTLVESKPVFDALEAVDENMDQLRDNVTWLVAMGVLNGDLPPWDATPHGADLDKPDYIEAVHSIDGRKIKCTYTYTGDDITARVYAFDDGGGYANFSYGSAAISFNGSGQWTGTVWS